MGPQPPTFGMTAVTPAQLLERNKGGARKFALQPHDRDLGVLVTWCEKYNLDRYHMPDAKNLLRLLEKMNYIQGLQYEEEVREVAFRVGSILIKKFLGVKRSGDGRAARTKEVGVLSGEVGRLWMETTGKGEGGVEEVGDGEDREEGTEEGEHEKKVEEVENGEEVEEAEHGETAQDDSDSLARLENAYATGVRQPHKFRATLAAAAADELKTPAPAIITARNTPRQNRPTPAHLLKTTHEPAPTDDDLVAKLNQAKLYMAEINKTKLNELYNQRKALIESIAARKAEEQRLESQLRVKREEMVLLIMSIDA